MKVGDYVRTKSNGIQKIDEEGRIDLGLIRPPFHIIKEEELLKSSPNIIDLIEENDLLKIEYFSLRYDERVTRLFEVTYKDDKNIILDNAKCSFMLINNDFNDENKKLNPIIKSIVTKEQFEEMEYKL